MKKSKKMRYDNGMNFLKRVALKIWDCLFEIFIWFLFLWLGGIATVCTILMPKEGIMSLAGAIALTFIPRVYKRLKKTKTEEE